MELDRFTHLTFDCYGTLIDWETGILDALTPVLQRHGIRATPADVLALYAEHEAAIEAGRFEPYRNVLRLVMSRIAGDLGFAPSVEELDVLSDSAGRWPAFADTTDSLRRLAQRFRLAVISNVDDEIFEDTRKLLGVDFVAVITAQQVGSYKPSRANFHRALERLAVAPRQVLHVAQSLYHDHVPAKELGIATVWVNRPSLRPGVGVAPAVHAAPDLEVPDLRSLADAMGL